jgi:hypothetical protein
MMWGAFGPGIGPGIGKLVHRGTVLALVRRRWIAREEDNDSLWWRWTLTDAGRAAIRRPVRAT